MFSITQFPVIGGERARFSQGPMEFSKIHEKISVIPAEAGIQKPLDPGFSLRELPSGRHPR